MAFQELFTDNAPPSRVWTDKGTEFYNQHVKRILTANNVTLYSTENEENSSVVERWNRTMKNIMWKYFTANNTLPGMVESTIVHITDRSSKSQQVHASQQTISTCIMHSIPKSMLEKLHNPSSTLGIRCV